MAAESEVNLNLASDTLRGDVRDAVLAEFKHLAKPWQAMSEEEQDRAISRADSIARDLVQGSIDLVAARGLPAIPIEVGKITMDGAALEGKFKCYADDDSLLRARHLQSSRAMFVLASPEAFKGEREPAEPTTDQPGLPLDAGTSNLDLLAQKLRANGPPAGAAPFHAPPDDLDIPTDLWRAPQPAA